MSVLARLGEPSASPLVVLCLRAALDCLEAPERFRSATRVIRVGDQISPASLVELWLAGGYEPSPLVDGPGQFSRRGGILDVFPPVGRPCRIEFFGDEIESLRVFDPETQRSGERLREVQTPPARDRPDEAGDGRVGRATIFDHLPPETLIVLDEPDQIGMVARDLEQQAEELRVELQERGELPADTDRPYVPWPELRARLVSTERTVLDLIHDPANETVPFTHAPTFGGRLKTFLNQLGGAMRS